MIIGTDMRKRRIVLLFLLTILPYTLFALDYEEAFDTVYNGIFASVASYFSVPRINLDGLSFELDQSSQIKKISFNRVDMAKVSEGLKNNMNNSSWYGKILAAASKSFSPIMQLATSQLDESDYSIGEAILDGSIELEYNKAYPFGSLLDLFVKNDWTNINFSFFMSIIVSGDRFSSPVLLEGSFDVKGGSNQKITVSCNNLEINNTQYEVTPVVFSN